MSGSNSGGCAGLGMRLVDEERVWRDCWDGRVNTRRPIKMEAPKSDDELILV